MRTLKLTIAYDGTDLVGWQRQREGRSVQGLLEEALARLEGGAVTVHGAGRTDAGVHALGQVASVRVSNRHAADVLVRALNAQLPPDVRVLAVEEAPEDFHARFSARGKTYRYVIGRAPIASPFARRYCWHLPESMDVEAMAEAAGALVGTHDFAAFRSAGTDTETTTRTIARAGFVAGGPPAVPAGGHADAGAWLTFEIAGDGFLRHMVRAIVGTLVEVGRGARRPPSVGALLAGGTRGDAGPTAPPHGLFLVLVDYD